MRIRRGFLAITATAALALLWAGHATGTEGTPPGDSGDQGPAACIATSLPPLATPELSPIAAAGFLRFAAGPGNEGPPLALDPHVATLSPQQVPQHLQERAASTTNPAVPLRFRFVHADLQRIGEALATVPNNGVVALDLFPGVRAELATERFRLAELTSGNVVHWWGRLRNPQAGASRVVKAWYAGTKLRAWLSQAGRDYHIHGIPDYPGLYLILEFASLVEPDSTCGTTGGAS